MLQNGEIGSGNGANTNSSGSTTCTIAFMDIQSAAKALSFEHKIDNRLLTTRYYEPISVTVNESPTDKTLSNDEHRSKPVPSVPSAISLSSSLPSSTTLTNGDSDYVRVHHNNHHHHHHHNNRHSNNLSSTIHHFNNRRGFYSSPSANSLPSASAALYGNSHRVWTLPTQTSLNFDNNRIRHRANIDLPDDKILLKRKLTHSQPHRKPNTK